MKIASIFIAVFALATVSAFTADRVALVLGNDAYPDVPLTNAVGDARAVKEMLTDKLGFSAAGIVYDENADRLTIFEKFETFKDLAAEAEIVIFFYAGHGMESLDGKENFLIPVDAPVNRVAESEAALRAAGVNLMDLIEKLAAASTGAKIILMDCCRERPAGRGATRPAGGLSTYADGEIPADTLMILAAAPDRVASDGKKHGPFTGALLEVLPGNGGSLMDAFFAVSDRVRLDTSNQQVPWMKFDGSGQIFRQQQFLARAAVTLPPEESKDAMVEAEIERRAREMAEKMAAATPMKSTPAPVPPVDTIPAVTREPASGGGLMSRIAEFVKGGGHPATSDVTPSPKETMETTPMVQTIPEPPVQAGSAYGADLEMVGRRAGEVRTFDGIEMVWCPPGEFLMGSPESEAERGDDETRHRVTLTRGFWLAKTECTQAQWESVMETNVKAQKASGWDGPHTSGEVTAVGPDVAMYFVSHNDTAMWSIGMLRKSNSLPAGWHWDLPSEAQWEYACRAGTDSAFASATEANGTESNCDGRYPYGTDTKGPYLGKVNQVAMYAANAWGLYDMHGNVYEWCKDDYGDYPSGSVTDPLNESKTVQKVGRGGAWNITAKGCRSAARVGSDGNYWAHNVGFRPAIVYRP